MSTEETPEQPQRGRQLTIASVAAAVLLAGGGGAVWASMASGPGDGTSSGARGPSDPPPLVLDGLGQPVAHDAPERGIAKGEPNPNGVAYQAKGSLPTGPETAAVHRPNAEITKSEVAEIAEALHLSGTPTKKDGAWRVAGSGDGSGASLTVDSDRADQWSFSRAGDSVGDDGEPVSAKHAKQAVKPVLDALELRGASLDASSTEGALRVVSVQPRIGGLPAQDWASTFTVGANGTISSGHGHLGDLAQGAEYPVMTAQETLRKLNQHHASGAGAPPCDASAPPKLPTASPEDGQGQPESDVITCSTAGSAGQPATVTDATFALTTRESKGETVLVPSWVYDVRQPGGTRSYEVSFPAVESEFVQRASGESSQQGSGHAPGRPDSPRELGPDGMAPTSYTVEGRTVTVYFWGGVCHDYRATAKETGQRVTISIKAEESEQDRPCIAIARRQTVTVKLDKPLGDREVVEASSEEPLPRKKPDDTGR